MISQESRLSVSSQADLNKWCVSSTNGHVKPWELKPQQKDLMQVLRRPVETTWAERKWRQLAAPGKGGRGKVAESAKFLVHPETLSQARPVLTFSRPLAKAVRDSRCGVLGVGGLKTGIGSRASTSRSLFRAPSGPFKSADSLFERTPLTL